MALLTIVRYQSFTGDTTTASAVVWPAILEAQELLEDELGRIGLLEDDGDDKTERLRIYDDNVLGGVVYPTAVPITDPGDYTQVGAGLTGAAPDGGPYLWAVPEERYATVVYQGGYDDDTVPAYMARDLAFAAYQLLHADTLVGIPAGATSVRLGDAAITYASPTSGGTSGISWSKQTLRHRRRRL